MVNLIKTIVFNGWTNAINKATGLYNKACILSVVCDKSEFIKINLSEVDPKECFKSLKGISANKISNQTPVKPIITIANDDKRFVSSQEIGIDSSTNLASMHWEDFEHLIREIFEKEFRKRKKRVDTSWRMDETYLKVNGTWHYYYRAVDKNGDTVDYLLRSKRDTIGAHAFFKKATKNNGDPHKINIDKSGSNSAGINAINKENGTDIEFRQNKYLNNRIEGDHRFIKQRTRLMLGFKKSNSAKRTLSGIETIHMIRKNQLKDGDPKLTNYGKFVSLLAA